jgi:ABC-type polysaccharide/polyol phosphate transport system ATPase subunit
VIQAESVGVRFLFDRHRRVITSAASRFRRTGSQTWGLRDLSFSIGAGQGVALLGPSGSGKTTLLRLIAGVYEADTGRLSLGGKVASLLSVDAGLMALLTGRENALHLGVLAGLSRTQSRAALEDVKARSGLHEYFERPVSSYSQGMRARLGFAVADETSPTIMVLDEVHEALDHEFRDILERRAHELVASGGVVVAAGHDHPMLERLCDRALYLSHGQLKADGAFTDVQRRYLDEVHAHELD